MKNVKGFGDVGDGKTKDTAALPATVDAEGTAFILEGTFIFMTIAR